jgi:hypothetical protein
MLNILCLSALVCNARAQHLFDMGLKGGIGQDDLSTSYAHSPLFGGHAGVFARVPPRCCPVFKASCSFPRSAPAYKLRT